MQSWKASLHLKYLPGHFPKETNTEEEHLRGCLESRDAEEAGTQLRGQGDPTHKG